MDIRDKWSKREKVLIDLKLLKEWYPKEWKTLATKDLANEVIRKFIELDMMEGDFFRFTQDSFRIIITGVNPTVFFSKRANYFLLF